MKKRFQKLAAALTAAVMAVSLIPASSICASAVGTIPGDVDGDNMVNSSDALLIIRCSVGLAHFTDEQFEIADVNSDLIIDSSDALLVLQKSIGVGALAVTELSPENKQALDFESEVLRLCNNERTSRGLEPLMYNSGLKSAADIRIDETKTLFDHTRPNGEKWSTILNENNFRYLAAGENIAAGIKTPAEVVEAWMNSEGHRKNILNPEFNTLGVSYKFFEDSQYGYYWTQVFAKISVDLDDEQASEKRLLERINAERKAKGMGALTLDSALANVAETRADDLTVKVDNNRPDGTDWKALVEDLPYWIVGQTYCVGQQNENEVWDFYANSSNTPKFLDPSRDYKKIGIGHAFKENDIYSHYWVIILTD